MKHSKLIRPRIPSAWRLPDGLSTNDFEWEETQCKAGKALHLWEQRQQKRLALVKQEIAALDKRILEKDREQLWMIGIEIQRDLDQEAEKERRQEKASLFQVDTDASAKENYEYVRRKITHHVSS